VTLESTSLNILQQTESLSVLSDYYSTYFPHKVVQQSFYYDSLQLSFDGFPHYNPLLYARELEEKFGIQFDSLPTCSAITKYMLPRTYDIYGSSRLGSMQASSNRRDDDNLYSRKLGGKGYEITDHLGNVHTVISDRKLWPQDTTVDGFQAEVLSRSDYYPFGMQIENRTFGDSTVSRGFQGMEKDDEIAGTGNSYTAKFWQYSPRVVQRWNLDPKPNPSISPYAIMAGNPIMYTDPLGDSIRTPKNLFDPSKAGTEGYNDEGLNKQDWETFSSGIQEISGVTLATPSVGDKNLSIESVDESIGSEGARNEFMGLLKHKKMHQDVEITNNNPDVLGAQNITAYSFDKQGNFLSTKYNAGLLQIDLADFRQWQSTNSGIKGTTDNRALGVGFSFLHENYHNRGFGMSGVTKSTLKTWDAETPVINQINTMRQQMGLPNRSGHSRSYDNVGGYLKFDDGTKYYIK